MSPYALVRYEAYRAGSTRAVAPAGVIFYGIARR